MPQATEEDHHAFAIFSLLANGSGGIDWSGLPLLAGYYGIDDVQGLMQRIAAIKLYKAPSNS